MDTSKQPLPLGVEVNGVKIDNEKNSLRGRKILIVTLVILQIITLPFMWWLYGYGLYGYKVNPLPEIIENFFFLLYFFAIPILAVFTVVLLFLTGFRADRHLGRLGRFAYLAFLCTVVSFACYVVMFCGALGS